MLSWFLEISWLTAYSSQMAGKRLWVVGEPALSGQGELYVRTASCSAALSSSSPLGGFPKTHREVGRPSIR